MTLVVEVPELLELWHPNRNTVCPEDAFTGSTRRVWWRCPEGPDHEWEAVLQSVARSVETGHRGCPFCRGLRVSVTNSVRTKTPRSAEQWHPSRNGDLTPDDVVAGSNKPVWWKCPEGPDHEWEVAPVDRQGSSEGVCPFCVSRRVSVTNRLSLHAPGIASQWHPTLNGDLTPDQVVVSAQRSVWWKCPEGPDHEWKSPVHRRTANGMGCPFCAGRRPSVTNSIRTVMPRAIPLWNPTRNGNLTPDDVTAGTADPVWWKCDRGPDHEWSAAPLVLRRSLGTKNRGCPFCAGKRPSVTNSLDNHPRLAAEVHPTRNGNLTSSNIAAGSSRKIWWRCQTNLDHEWQASVVNRLRGRNCPFCKVSLRSFLETSLSYELQTIFEGIVLTEDKIDDGGRPIHVDILIPGPRLAIEVDGRYHHAERHDADRKKSQRIRGAGWHHLRVREESLGPLDDEDVVVPDDSAVKPIMDALLLRLLKLGWAPDHTAAIRLYLDESQPRRMAEAVVDVTESRQGRRVRVPTGQKKQTRRDRWDSGYAHLAAFVEREGHAQPPDGYREGEFPLGSWVSRQRSQYRKGVLEPERAARLEVLPRWSWDPADDTFEWNFALYASYVQRTGHAYIPVVHREQGLNLGTWVRCIQRGTVRLNDDRWARLEALPGWSWDRADWTAMSAGVDLLGSGTFWYGGAGGATYSQIATELGVGKTTIRRALTQPGAPTL